MHSCIMNDSVQHVFDGCEDSVEDVLKHLRASNLIRSDHIKITDDFVTPLR